MSLFCPFRGGGFAERGQCHLFFYRFSYSVASLIWKLQCHFWMLQEQTRPSKVNDQYDHDHYDRDKKFKNTQVLRRPCYFWIGNHSYSVLRNICLSQEKYFSDFVWKVVRRFDFLQKPFCATSTQQMWAKSCNQTYRIFVKITFWLKLVNLYFTVCQVSPVH